jgi:hypothetical protein
MAAGTNMYDVFLLQEHVLLFLRTKTKQAINTGKEGDN